MPKLNSKFVKQLEKSDDSNLCTLYVKGDWNDVDYITELINFSRFICF